MRLFVFLPAMLLLSMAVNNCSHSKAGKVYKGRLEVKAMCMNYTISVIDGNIDTSLVEASWTDETTRKTYSNAFRLGSPCTFPPSINAGDEFYFTIDDDPKGGQCAVCMVYYPTPKKKLSIRVKD